MKVYRAIVLSILLYGAETWALCAYQLDILNKFHLDCLRRMLRNTWRDKKKTIMRPSLGAAFPTYTVSLQIQYPTLVGHVEKMKPEQIPKQVFYSELAADVSSAGRPRKVYKKHIKDVKKRCSIFP